MKKLSTYILVLFGLLCLAGAALGQTDPKDQSPVVVLAAGTGTDPIVSSKYAVITSAAGETVFFQVTGGTGVWLVEGSLDTEAAVKAGTAVWTPLLSSSTIPTIGWIADPPPYLRITTTPATGTIRVLMRGNGTTFRVVQ